jgi:hypothetical protein
MVLHRNQALQNLPRYFSVVGNALVLIKFTIRIRSPIMWNSMEACPLRNADLVGSTVNCRKGSGTSCQSHCGPHLLPMGCLQIRHPTQAHHHPMRNAGSILVFSLTRRIIRKSESCYVRSYCRPCPDSAGAEFFLPASVIKDTVLALDVLFPSHVPKTWGWDAI